MNADTEFDTLRRQWREMQDRLEAQQALNLQLLTENRIERARSSATSSAS